MASPAMRADFYVRIFSSAPTSVEVVFSPSHLDYKNLGVVRQVASRIEELGMEAYSFHAPFANDIDISSPDFATREHALDEILYAVEAASMLGVHYFVIHPGPENADIPSREERMVRIENVISVLNRVATRRAEAGIKCVLENKLPHLLFRNSSDIVWILGSLETNEVGAWTPGMPFWPVISTIYFSSWGRICGCFMCMTIRATAMSTSRRGRGGSSGADWFENSCRFPSTER